MPHHDIVIIGSGSGNSLVTPELADADIAIIEGAPWFGGTCLNVGCIPTKMFVLPADRAIDAQTGERLGVRTRFDGADWPAIRDRVFGRIDPIAAAGEAYRRDGERTTLYRGHARFVGPRRLVVDLPEGAVEVTADQVVIAAGSHAFVPPEIAQSDVETHTSDTIMRLEELPERLLVVGGGYIALEMAHVFEAFGSAVTLAVRGEDLLREADDVVRAVVTAAARERYDVRTGVSVTALRREDDGIHATLTDGAEVVVDEVLVATGRRPSTDDLGVELAGVDLRQDGRVVVDEHGRTTAEGVWALGDVSSPYMLKHVANHEARVVAHNLAHPEDLHCFIHDAVPYAVFTHPQVASVGMTTQEARDAGHDVVVKVQEYGSTAYGWALEDRTSRCVLVGDRRTGALLGGHVVGPQASSLIQPVVQTLALGSSLLDLARGQYWIHPALTEVVENAALGLLETMQTEDPESIASAQTPG
ncbi:mycothione reductase [Janibacter melonis]|uniref:mycothione reductase n=1 Tax=Janibacter melonis TaxID=262209 RepID=UPI001E2CF749|nr:mycothione reductase [Janibacter melonis]MCB5992797.1 mycothione reductase [Janibacter melonis]